MRRKDPNERKDMRLKDPNERKDHISIALKTKTIRTIDEVAKKEDRSRSDIIQRILDKYLQQPKPSKEARTTEIPAMFG